jgi:hypothetical protein
LLEAEQGEVMQIPSWAKTTTVAAAGGAISGGSAALLAPEKFNIHFGNGHLALIMLQGALVAVGALFINSPRGKKLLSTYQKVEDQAAKDQATIANLKTEIKKNGGN